MEFVAAFGGTLLIVLIIRIYIESFPFFFFSLFWERYHFLVCKKHTFTGELGIFYLIFKMTEIERCNHVKL